MVWGVPSPPRPAPRKEPRQERSRALYAAILTAAAELLEQAGPAFTLAEVAARAGVAVGSFYQYFPDRAALIGALIDRQLEADRAAIERFKSMPESARAGLPEQLVAGVLELYGARPRSMSSMVALLRELGRDADVAALVDELCRALAARLERDHPQSDAAAREDAASAAIHGLLGIIRRAASDTPERLVGDDAFRERLVRVTRAALALD